MEGEQDAKKSNQAGANSCANRPCLPHEDAAASGTAAEQCMAVDQVLKSSLARQVFLASSAQPQLSSTQE